MTAPQHARQNTPVERHLAILVGIRPIPEERTPRIDWIMPAPAVPNPT